MTTSSSFDLPYVRSLRELKEDLKARKKSECSYKARRYFLKNFGFDIDDCDLDFSGAGMWRQFFGLHFENIVAEVFCRSYSFDRFDLTYVMDGFTTRNPFKYSLVKPKFARKREKGRAFEVRKYSISDDFVERQVLEDIRVFGSDETSIHFHAKLAERAGMKIRSADLSDFLSGFVHSAINSLSKDRLGKVLETLFILRDVGGKRVREKLKFDDGFYRKGDKTMGIDELLELSAQGLVFPSARTYYSQLYLFLPGIIAPGYAQIEAVFELADDSIFKPAVEGFKLCKEVTGFYPLIIPMPDFNLLEEFRFTKNPACVCMCTELEFNFNPTGNFYEDMLSIGTLIYPGKQN